MQLAKHLLMVSKELPIPIKTTDSAGWKEWTTLCRFLRDKAAQGSTSAVVNSTAIEGKGFNLRQRLGLEGFSIIPLPNKRYFILWNC